MLKRNLVILSIVLAMTGLVWLVTLEIHRLAPFNPWLTYIPPFVLLIGFYIPAFHAKAENQPYFVVAFAYQLMFCITQVVGILCTQLPAQTPRKPSRSNEVIDGGRFIDLVKETSITVELEEYLLLPICNQNKDSLLGAVLCTPNYWTIARSEEDYCNCHELLSRNQKLERSDKSFRTGDFFNDTQLNTQTNKAINNRWIKQAKLKLAVPNTAELPIYDCMHEVNSLDLELPYNQLSDIRWYKLLMFLCCFAVVYSKVIRWLMPKKETPN